MGMERPFFVFSDLTSVMGTYLGTYLDEKDSSILKSLSSNGRPAAPLIGLRQLALLGVKEGRQKLISDKVIISTNHVNITNSKDLP